MARSSLNIALYWQRRSADCARHVQAALIRSFAAREGGLTEEPMKNHLLKHVTSLDLRAIISAPAALREVLSL